MPIFEANKQGKTTRIALAEEIYFNFPSDFIYHVSYIFQRQASSGHVRDVSLLLLGGFAQNRQRCVQSWQVRFPEMLSFVFPFPENKIPPLPSPPHRSLSPAQKENIQSYLNSETGPVANLIQKEGNNLPTLSPIP